VPTDFPESDGTFEWDATTMVMVILSDGEYSGLGYTYGNAAAAALARDALLPAVAGKDPSDIPACWNAMTRAVRNDGDDGIARLAISAVDNALWDLKARKLGLPLAKLLGMRREEIPAYGSGGFTSYPQERLQGQLAAWAREGFRMVKMKVGRDPDADPHRVEAAREAVGGGVDLFVDANGAYGRKQAQALALSFARQGVSWFEEPVTYRDIDGLAQLRESMPAGMDLAAGEYSFTVDYLRRLFAAGAVDVLQVDATRCGISGFLAAGALCAAYHIPMSSHCAPSLHAALGCCVPAMRNLEYFHDHVRIEHMFFDGAADVRDGMVRPDPGRPGLGLELKERDAGKFRIEI
jgi:L-alanine-DL-glutamate epimerase-like enolase superfamily enzyme